MIVLNFEAVSVIWASTASGEPRERNSVATGEPACWRTAPPPTRWANVGSPVMAVPASSRRTACSTVTQLPTVSR